MPKGKRLPKIAEASLYTIDYCNALLTLDRKAVDRIMLLAQGGKYTRSAMSYEIYDGTRSRGQFASNKGYSDLAIYAQRGNYKVLRAFFKFGVTGNVRGATEELERIATEATSDIATTAYTLKQKIAGVRYAVISNGVL